MKNLIKEFWMSFSKGKFYEEKVAKYLKSKGYELVDQNYRFQHLEIDLIAFKSKVLIFFEVKFRKVHQDYNPYAAIDEKKKKNVALCSSYFLDQHSQFQEFFCRYDAIFILDQKGSEKIYHFKDIYRL